YAWLNPNLSIQADWRERDWSGESIKFEPTNRTWQKWLPSSPTSPHWYTQERLEHLIGRYIANERGEITVREFISEFRGLSGTAKQRLVLEATRLARSTLSDLVNGNAFEPGVVANLLTAMKQHTKPVKPDMLGTIGREHFEKRVGELGGEMKSFTY